MPPVRDGNEKEEDASMPNHVYNFIEFSCEGDAQQVWGECSREVASPGSDLDSDSSPSPNPPESPERRFDFNSLIPMPEGLADAEESSDMRRALAYALYSTDPDMESARDVFSEKLSPRERYRVDDAWESLVASGIDRSEQESLSKSAAQYARNLSEHGHLTWYTWAYANWNTKWNAYESSLCGRTISFTTAWCAPIPVFEALIAKYPDVPMNMSWYEEQGIENTGEIVSDGKGNVWYYQGG